MIEAFFGLLVLIAVVFIADAIRVDHILNEMAQNSVTKSLSPTKKKQNWKIPQGVDDEIQWLEESWRLPPKERGLD